jgi:CubicO group peptidase (beta-lactamase class C family)
MTTRSRARRATVLACLVSIVSGASIRQASPARVQDSKTSLDKLLDQIRERTHLPGIAAAAVRDGKIVAAGVSGVRELGKPDAIQASDRFLIGSCTKPMTRLLFARLIQAGKIAADAKLPDLLPGVKMRDEYRNATLADLMRHTAGLQPYTRITPKETPIVFELQGTPMERRGRFAEHVLLEAPAGAVGKDFVYSNAAYAILGNIAERKMGKPWEDLMAEEVFKPLHIGSVTIGLPEGDAAAGMPRGHERTPKGYEVAKHSPPVAGLLAPAGGVVLTIEDFARFAIAEVAVERGDGGDFLSRETCAKLPALRPKDAGSEEGGAFFGGQGTYTAAFAVWPSKGFGVVVCTNGGGSDDGCQAAIDAIRAACAPEIVESPRPILAGGPASGRKLGIQVRAEPDGPFVIVKVEPGSLGEKGGLQADDEVVALDGKAIGEWDQDEIIPAIRAPKAKLTVLRGGKKIELEMPGE